MKRLFIIALLALLTITVYGQTDSTKVKKKKKIDWVSVHGTVADSFTKMGILDVKIILVEEDSTVISTSKVYESYGYSSGIGGSANIEAVSYRFSQKPKKETGGLD